MPLEDMGMGDARTLRAAAAATEAEGRFGYGAHVGTEALNQGAVEFVDVRKYATGSDGHANDEDVTGADKSDDHNDWDLSFLDTASPDNIARHPEVDVWRDIAAAYASGYGAKILVHSDLDPGADGGVHTYVVSTRDALNVHLCGGSLATDADEDLSTVEVRGLVVLPNDDGASPDLRALCD